MWWVRSTSHPTFPSQFARTTSALQFKRVVLEFINSLLITRNAITCRYRSSRSNGPPLTSWRASTAWRLPHLRRRSWHLGGIGESCSRPPKKIIQPSKMITNCSKTNVVESRVKNCCSQQCIHLFLKKIANLIYLLTLLLVLISSRSLYSASLIATIGFSLIFRASSIAVIASLTDFICI